MTVSTMRAKSPYAPPTLRRGPVLTAVAAVTSEKKAVCWIARAAFGEDDIRWMVFREWLLADAPAWFRGSYLRYGERVGAWISDRPRLRAVVRRAMGVAIRRKLRPS